jgi:hypothetical protein
MHMPPEGALREPLRSAMLTGQQRSFAPRYCLLSFISARVSATLAVAGRTCLPAIGGIRCSISPPGLRARHDIDRRVSASSMVMEVSLQCCN